MAGELDTIVTRSDRLAQRVFEEQQLVITVADSQLHRFNEVGTYIWQVLESPMSKSTLVEAVLAHFETPDPAGSRTEILAFIESLRQKGLVQISDSNEGQVR